jgi:ethanolamine utilization protein EutA (predicted chaperonin)
MNNEIIKISKKDRGNLSYLFVVPGKGLCSQSFCEKEYVNILEPELYIGANNAPINTFDKHEGIKCLEIDGKCLESFTYFYP